MPSVLIIGAHPDDAEVKGAGTTCRWVEHGIRVTFAIMTDGSAGHHQMSANDLVARRLAEAKESATRLGAAVEWLGYPDGLLVPSLEARLDVIRLIRRTKADLVLTHRPADYHPDHRYTAQIVQDAAYMVTVPRIAPEVPILKHNPIFAYFHDRFTKPTPFTPHVVVPVDDYVERIVHSLDAHASQFYEWLPHNMGILNQIPTDPNARQQQLKEWFVGRYCLKSSELSPGSAPPKSSFVEAWEISEYGSPLTPESRRQLFPFLD
jgi:LmbE family N-acetylglucosaminyl deacetylase